MVTAAAVISSCAPKTENKGPEEPLEECVYSVEMTNFAVWSPDAEAAQVKLYRSAQDSVPFSTYEMCKSKDGLWKVTVEGDIKGVFYAFQIKMDGLWLEETAGIAAKAVGVNGWRGAVVDWAETDPEGWAEDKSPVVKPSDIIVYELQHRDFSIHPTSGIDNRGKYLALTETGATNPDGLATGIDHLSP